MTNEETAARMKLLEEIADGLVDMLDGEPSGSDSLDWALHQYGYRPTKGVEAPDEATAPDPVEVTLRRPVVPELLVDAYSKDPIVWTVFQHGAIQGWDLPETLSQLAVALSKAREETMRGYAEHMQTCSQGLVPVVRGQVNFSAVSRGTELDERDEKKKST